MGHSRKIGRAAKMGWEKILLPAIVADLAPRIRFYLHKEFRAAGIRFLSTQRINGGDLEENGHSFKENALRACCCCFVLNRHSLLENRPLVDFEIENERKSHKIAYI